MSLPILSGTIAGAEEFVEIRRWALLHMDVLRRFLLFASGVPGRGTLNDILNSIDAELFATCFTQRGRASGTAPPALRRVPRWSP